jgi:FkbH-like protein
LALSEEDRLRYRDYTVRAVRDVEAHQDDLEAFLKSLEMEATIEEIGPSNIERVVTMLGKTNQFNLTTRRHGRGQVQAMLELPGSILLTLRLRDKFGEQGIVALSLAVPSNDSNALQIDSFLVSCRALGRGVEDALWSAMVSRALAQGVRKLDAEYRATAKNALAAKFYDKVGLQSVARDSSAVQYRLEPIEAHPSPSWIVVHNRSNER